MNRILRGLAVAVPVLGALAVAGGASGVWEVPSDAGPTPSGASVRPWNEAVVTPTRAPRPTPTPTPTPAPPAGLDLATHSTSDPLSPWVVVNKQHPLPAEHVPPDLVPVGDAMLRAAVAPDLAAMLDGAAAAGLRLEVRSGYRSYTDQAATRADIEARRGFAHAERYSARPGFSEHQTGLAVDIDSGSQPACNLQACFARTPEGMWLAEHAWEYGFVVRYTEENTAVTGYAPAGWHLRWVGRDLTAELRARGVTSLEELFGVPGGPDYPAP